MTTKENMNAHRKTAIIVGALILFAYAAVSRVIHMNGSFRFAMASPNNCSQKKMEI